MLGKDLQKEYKKLNEQMDSFEQKYREKIYEGFYSKNIDIDYSKFDNKITVKKDGLIITEINISSNQKENLSNAELVKMLKYRLEEIKESINIIKGNGLYHK